MLAAPAWAATKVLGLDEFVRIATKKDTEFEEVLLERLEFQYRDDLTLPARDIVLSVKQSHYAFLAADRNEPGTSVGLSKLFPLTGTDVGLEYSVSPSLSSETLSSQASVSLTQPIAQNALGRNTRLLKRIVGLEVDIARHQVVEAYEDHLAAVYTAYYNWYQAYASREIGRSSYAENEKLLVNIQEREKKQVARPIDVNKIRLQVLAKKERLVSLEEDYRKTLHVVQRMIRHSGAVVYVPSEPKTLGAVNASFANRFKLFTEQSRTMKVLNLLIKKSGLEVDREADDLLPSINIVIGGEVSGEDYSLDESEDLVYAALELVLPFPDQVDDAEHEMAGIARKRAELRKENVRYRLYTDIRNLHHEVKKEEQLAAIFEEKVGLATSILKDETENYSFGKVTLNDYISAVNVLDNNLFGKVQHEARVARLRIELLRLTDRLVLKEPAK
jgi:outer membrane protein TolC